MPIASPASSGGSTCSRLPGLERQRMSDHPDGGPEAMFPGWSHPPWLYFNPVHMCFIHWQWSKRGRGCSPAHWLIVPRSWGIHHMWGHAPAPQTQASIGHKTLLTWGISSPVAVLRGSKAPLSLLNFLEWGSKGTTDATGQCQGDRLVDTLGLGAPLWLS